MHNLKNHNLRNSIGRQVPDEYQTIKEKKKKGRPPSAVLPRPFFSFSLFLSSLELSDTQIYEP